MPNARARTPCRRSFVPRGPRAKTHQRPTAQCTTPACVLRFSQHLEACARTPRLARGPAALRWGRRVGPRHLRAVCNRSARPSPGEANRAACACAGAVTDRGVHAGAETMFADVRALQQLWVAPPPNTINTWAEPQNALGVTPNRVANSNEVVGNNSCYPAWEGTCPLPLAETKAEALA